MGQNEIRMPAGEFKARCLQVMAEVERTRRPVTITKRGRPVARLVPVEAEVEPFLGSLRARIRIVGDITKPTERVEIWETEKEWTELCRDNPHR
jgi:prevent-host-death family protein